MLAVLAALMIALGWLFIRGWVYTRYDAHRFSSNNNYYGAILAALYIATISVFAHTLLFSIPVYHDAIFVAAQIGIDAGFKIDGDQRTPKLLSLGLIAAALTPLSVFLLNRPIFSSRDLLLAIGQKTGEIDELEDLAIRCYRTGIATALTLSSGKVYVGFLESSGIEGSNRKWLALWPLASGHRIAGGKLELSVFYLDVYAKTAAAIGPAAHWQDFRVVVASSEVVSAQAFDFRVYEKFFINDSAAAAQPAPEPTPHSHESPKADANPRAFFDEKHPELLIIGRDSRKRLAFYFLYVALYTISFALLALSPTAAALCFGLAIAISSHATK